jgi:hypothetical protein
MFQVYMLQPMTSACDLFGAGGRRCSVAEPGLDELMSDPMTLALMQADGVDRHEFDALVAQVRENLL